MASAVQLQSASREPVRARRGMVGSTDEHASRAGLQVLQQGGNAVDAAVAVGFALAVTHPAAGNIGGGGFMVIRMADGRETTIDYREMAPGRAHRDMFLDPAGEPVAARSRSAPWRRACPDRLPAWPSRRQRYGRLSLAAVMAPAIALARDGIPVSWALSDSLKSAQRLLAQFPSSARVFLKPDGSALSPDDRLVQPDLARTLDADRRSRGPTRSTRAQSPTSSPPRWSAAAASSPRPTSPPTCPASARPSPARIRGHRVVSMPPPSSGGVALVQLLNILEGFPLGELRPQLVAHDPPGGRGGAARVRRSLGVAWRSGVLRRAGRRACSRAGMRSACAAASPRPAPRRAATSSPGSPAAFEHSETTHYSVVDADGNAVATTTTLNGSYGNGQMVTGAGFLLNNEMDDFSAKPGTPNMFGLVGGEANAVAPGKRMLSSMTPTILVKDGKTRLVVGSPGGSRIITTVLQVVLNVVEFKMDVQQAVDAPRFHHQWLPDVDSPRAPGISRRRRHGARSDGPRHRGRRRTWATCTRS